MPEINFVLPHWLYWAGLVLFPLTAMVLFRKAKPSDTNVTLSLPLAYFLLLTGGFIGVHRLYLKSILTLVFVTLFCSVLAVNVEVRQARNDLSSALNDIQLAELKLQRAEKAVQKGRRNAEAKLAHAQEQLQQAQPLLKQAQESSDNWNLVANLLGAAILLFLIVDAFLLPLLVKQRREQETAPTEGFHCPAVESEYDDAREPNAFYRFTSRLNGLAGEFVAYWSVIAVFVYYYEVIARYVFNSPTNWAHESMFLMFGMQYLIAGGFVLREGGHVRVDVLYNYMSVRWKAISDILTSVFFFIFMFALLGTGWIFFHDSYSVSEVSFTEWAIQYWPIKFALPLGAALLILQGLSQLMKDIAILINPQAVQDGSLRSES
ncbi:MAG: TRAP transporter small permease subunit [Gammaproteobacteria bacterium]|nr:TRAP transporter small permease subunit [Gammaproteobacteria bacterium]MDH5802573.1 TRAP transporter small permease subunit [Gammaproteobacteria bacterium]